MSVPAVSERTIRKLYKPGDQRRVMWGVFELFKRIDERYLKTGLIDAVQFRRIGNYVASFAFTEREGGYRLPTRDELFKQFPHLEKRRAAMRRLRVRRRGKV